MNKKKASEKSENLETCRRDNDEPNGNLQILKLKTYSSHDE